MDKNCFYLTEAIVNSEVIIVSLGQGAGVESKFKDLGLSKGMRVKVINAQKQGPCLISLGSSKLVIGYGMASKVIVKKYE